MTHYNITVIDEVMTTRDNVICDIQDLCINGIHTLSTAHSHVYGKSLQI